MNLHRYTACLSKLTALATVALLGACNAGVPAGEEEDVASASEADCSVKLDHSRSLVVTDDAALESFTLEAVMSQIITSAGIDIAKQTPLQLYQQWFDTNNDAAHAQTNGPHCTLALNGFPVSFCPRQEGMLAATNPFTDGDDAYVPVGLVNRFDLAATDGADCGQYRIVFGKVSGLTSPVDRNMLIFDAKLPNPEPSGGINACRPVAAFWANLSKIDDPTARASELRAFYFKGLPGFEPAIHASHYRGSEAGSGQIRANQFMSTRPYFDLGALLQPWQLREYKLTSARCADAPCDLVMRESTVKNNPSGKLFTTDPGPNGSAFQDDFVTHQVPSLLGKDINQITVASPRHFDLAESTEQGTGNDYGERVSGNTAFLSAIQAKLSAHGSTLTPQNIVDRATTQSCAGCHQVSNLKEIGGGLTWPSSNVFTQIDERKTLSDAITGTFLPFRETVLRTFVCDATYESKSLAPTIGGMNE